MPACRAYNDFSIGIELVGDERPRFTERQYARLATTVATLRRRYPLRYAVGHADIAPARKIDPGPYFDWDRVLSSAAFAGLERPLPDAASVMGFRNAGPGTRA
jgi:N-acetyl-anhydromuramyl-L-alanine amidase AmpD